MSTETKGDAMSDQTELWAIIKVMGHAKYAGRVSEYAELGVPLIRVEVPAANEEAAFEKLLGASSIFRITPCTEETAREAARQFAVRPLTMVSLPSHEPARISHDEAPPEWMEDDEEDY